MTGVLLGQENSAQNTATAKTHFYMFKNITEGCQIIFIRTKCLSRILIETKDCIGPLQKPLFLYICYFLGYWDIMKMLHDLEAVPNH